MSAASRTRNVLGLLGAFVIASMVAGVLAAGLFLPAIGATGVTASKSVDFFDSLPGDLKTPPLAEKSRLLDRDGNVIAQFFQQDRINVTLDQISKPMQEAAIAIEDSRFYHHGGVDAQGLLRAFMVNRFRSGVVQGASTLTQQYVKNVLVQTAFAAGDDKAYKAAIADTPERKVKEIRYAVTLEKKMSKDEILNRYLNIAWFGKTTYGVEAAGLRYFNTHAKDLTIPQAALLAGMIQNADALLPTEFPAKALKRRNVVLQVMRDQALITPADYAKYSKQGLGLKVREPKNGCFNTSLENGFYCDYVVNLLERDDAYKALGRTEKQRTAALLRGGLTIQSNLDPKIQKAATKAVNDIVPSGKSPGVGSAAVTVQPGTGAVLAIAENRTWDPTSNKPGHTSINWAVDAKYGASYGFQTGSTFKPFTLATWLKQGKSLNALVSSATGTAPFSAFHSCVGLPRNQEYPYSNSEGSGDGKNISVFQATYASVNGAYVSMEKQLDLCDIAQTAEDFGLHLAAPQPDQCVVQEKLTQRIPRCIPSLTLGPKEISPMTMSAAYAGFAAQGLYCKPLAISAILDRYGKAIKDIPQGSCKQVLDKKVANTLNYGLSRVFKQGGTAARVGGLPDGRAASGKTGTTNDSRQTWFVGYTPNLSTAVWVGLYQPRNKSDSLNKRKIDGRITRVFGATYAAPIWKRIMTTATKGTPELSFARPDSELIKSPTTAVPNVAGMEVGAAIDKLKAAGFDPSADGGLVGSNYPAGRVAFTSPAGGSRVATGSGIQISISNGKGGNPGPGGGANGGQLLDNLFPGGNG